MIWKTNLIMISWTRVLNKFSPSVIWLVFQNLLSLITYILYINILSFFKMWTLIHPWLKLKFIFLTILKLSIFIYFWFDNGPVCTYFRLILSAVYTSELGNSSKIVRHLAQKIKNETLYFNFQRKLLTYKGEWNLR